MTGWSVEIVSYPKDGKDEEVVKTIACGSERRAERVERGVSINLDHERFFTRLVER